jgi:LAS superfamily LD-carboxypeptidase LdcB
MNRRNFIISTFKKTILSTLPISIFAKSDYNYKKILGLETIALVGQHYKLEKETYTALTDMIIDAQKDGLKIWCSSAYRSFYNQKQIWNQKYNSLASENLDNDTIINKILEFTSIPGTSRHHWGTDFDLTDALAYQINNPLSIEQYSEKGEFAYLHYWLTKNAYKYDIHQVYTEDINRGGILYEPWHYSYRPSAKKCLYQLLDVDLSKIYEIKAVKGLADKKSTFFEQYKLRYIKAINPIFL